MTDLFLKFTIILEDTEGSDLQKNYGPKFHRWLPDGKKDCIKIDTGHPDIDLEVWHERSGFVGSTFNSDVIRFDYKRTDIDPIIMAKQGVLQAGPLLGRLVYRNPPKSAISVINDSKTSISKLLNIYRLNFGQYWVPLLKQWDSREDSLGAYCKHMYIKCSLDSGSTWLTFLPDDPISNVQLTVNMDRHYREYITEKDWKNIPKLLYDRLSPTTAEIFFNRACDNNNKGEYRTALIDAVTSLELAIEEFIRRNTLLTNTLAKDMSAFRGLPLKARMITLLLVIKKNSTDEIEKAVEAIELRNKTVHDGQNPPNDTDARLSCLLQVITSFLPAPFYRFPTSNSGNAWAEPDNWNEIYHKSGFDPI
jgi:hypothetical protein